MKMRKSRHQDLGLDVLDSFFISSSDVTINIYPIIYDYHSDLNFTCLPWVIFCYLVDLCKLENIDAVSIKGRCNKYFSLLWAVCQRVRFFNPIILPQQCGHCVGGWLELHKAVVLVAAQQDLILRHCSDATWLLQQWAGERLQDSEAGIHLRNGVVFTVWYP